MDTVRLNITLPKDLAQALDRTAGPRRRSSFITEAIRHLIQKREKEELEALLEEGYRATAQESMDLSKEFEISDLEGWDEY